MIKSISKLSESFLFFILILFALIFTVGGFSYAVKDGIELWVATVLISLFPYFFISAVLSLLSVTGKIAVKLSPISKRLFNANGLIGYSFFLSVLSGYPVGAKTVSDLKTKNLISDSEAVRGSCFCSTSSPAFMIGSVGNIMFGNKIVGVLLFIIHFLSALITGIIFSFYKRKDKPLTSIATFSTADSLLYDGVYSAVISILIVGGLITVFSVIIEILFKLQILNPLINFINLFIKDYEISKGIIFGIFENTCGIKQLSDSGLNLLSFSFSAFLLGFGGLSIIAQSTAYLKKAKIKTAPFLLAKCVSAVLNFLLSILVYLVFF